MTVRCSVWLPRFAAHVMNEMRNGKDGKTSEMRRTGRRRSKPMAQFGQNVWFRKIGEDGVSSFASRMTQGIFVGHHDRTGAVLCITKKRSCARQKLEKTDTERCLGIDELGRFVWHSVANSGSELKLTKKVTADTEGTGPPLPRVVVGKASDVEPRRFYVSSADIEAHGHTGGCPGRASLASHGRALKPHNNEYRERT